MQDSFTSIFDILRLLAAGLRQVKGKSHTLMMGITQATALPRDLCRAGVVVVVLHCWLKVSLHPRSITKIGTSSDKILIFGASCVRQLGKVANSNLKSWTRILKPTLLNTGR